MGPCNKAVQPQARFRTGDLETVDISDGLLRAWREAAEMVQDEGAPGVLTTREICTEILGFQETEASLEKARRIIRQWKKIGICESVSTRRINLAERTTVVPGFRLLEQESQEDAESAH